MINIRIRRTPLSNISRICSLATTQIKYPLHHHKLMHSHAAMSESHQVSSAFGGDPINILENQPSGEPNGVPDTTVLKVGPHHYGQFSDQKKNMSKLQTWTVASDNTETMQRVATAAKAIQAGDYPVAFPTETVYGLGANARDSRAVQGIFKAKGRPSDNPLIVHISDLDMYEQMMEELPVSITESPQMGRYSALVERFWPGPLTLLFQKPPNYLAREVTAGLDTVGIRMPDSALARTLIKLAGVPVAAPSANSSTKPSPTTAQHVSHDLEGKIQYILDGGPCNIGVESTVVDGLREPPLVLRPGGVSIDEIRKCPGWEDVEKGYRDQSEVGVSAPRAPGMKYKHYSPNATVILCEDGLVPTPQETPGIKLINPEDGQEALEILGKAKRTRIHPVLKVGIIRTKHWERWLGWTGCSQGSTSGVRIMEAAVDEDEPPEGALEDDTKIIPSATNGTSTAGFTELKYHTANLTNHDGPDSFSIKLVDVSLGHNTQTIASGLFAALREMDKHGVDVIFVEAIKNDDSIAAAIMNRLKKAASQRWKPTEDGGVTKQFYGSG